MRIAGEHRARLDAELSAAKRDDYVHRSDVAGMGFLYRWKGKEAADVDTCAA